MVRDLDLEELQRVLGFAAGLSTIQLVDRWATFIGPAVRGQAEATERPAGETKASLDRVRRLASELADLLSDPGLIEFMACAAVERGKPDFAPMYPLEFEDASRELAGVVLEVRRIQELAEAAREGIKTRRGAPRDERTGNFLKLLVTHLSREGVHLSTAENATFVRALRVAWSRVGLDTDPRDLLRRMVKTGELDLEEWMARAAWFRGEISRAEYLRRVPTDAHLMGAGVQSATGEEPSPPGGESV